MGAAWSSVPTTPVPISDADKRDSILAMYHEYQASVGPCEQMTPAELLARQPTLRAGAASRAPSDIIVVDCRTAAERNVSIIPGSVTQAELEIQCRDDPAYAVGRPIVCYCTIGYRSGLAARQLTANGLPAANLVGSLLLWAHEGGALVDPRTGNEVRRMHVFGRRWDLAPSGFVTERFPLI